MAVTLEYIEKFTLGELKTAAQALIDDGYVLVNVHQTHAGYAAWLTLTAT